MLDKKQLKRYALVAVALVVAVISATLLFPKTDAMQMAGGLKQASRSDILGIFQSQAQIATTQVEIRRMGIYDSENEQLTLNPSTWKLGRRACVVPVDITVKFGIDLRKMQESDIELDTANIVRIRLPKPEIIDYSTEQRTNRRDIITISTLARSEVGEQTIQSIKNRITQEVIADSTLFRDLSIEIDNNTKSVFRSMLRSMGLQPEFIN